MNVAVNSTMKTSFALHTCRYLERALCILSRSRFLITYIFGLLAFSLQTSAGDLNLVEVAPGVFAHQGEISLMSGENQGAIANVGFIVGDSSVAVIDTGGSPAEGRALLKAIRERTILPVRYVINTHMHLDHVFGNAAFVGPDVAFAGHARLNAALKARFEHYVASASEEMGAAAVADVALVPITLEVEDRLELDLGNRKLILTAYSAAHTDNDLTVLDEATGTLFAGDLVFLDHLPTLDGSLTGWLAAIEALRAVPARQVIPGHGPVSSPWPDALEPQTRYFKALEKDVRAAIEAGVPLSEAATTAGRSEAGNWALFDQYNTRNATAAYAELEWR